MASLLGRLSFLLHLLSFFLPVSGISLPLPLLPSAILVKATTVYILKQNLLGICFDGQIIHHETSILCLCNRYAKCIFYIPHMGYRVRRSFFFNVSLFCVVMSPEAEIVELLMLL